MSLSFDTKHPALKDIDYPTFEISEPSDKKAKEALQQRNKATKVTGVSEYFKKF